MNISIDRKCILMEDLESFKKLCKRLCKYGHHIFIFEGDINFNIKDILEEINISGLLYYENIEQKINLINDLNISVCFENEINFIQKIIDDCKDTKIYVKILEENKYNVDFKRIISFEDLKMIQ